MIALLFSSTVLIWGTTWIAIAFQVGPVELLVSVFFRFALASILFLLALLVLGKLKIPERRHQIWLVAQSLCLFGLNFICFYKATSLIHSGLVSIIFSLATIFNAVNARIFFAERITKQVLFASFLGLLGLTLMFARDILTTDTEGTIQGIALACLGTLFFSLGNMISRRNSQEGISPTIANAWGMGYGALFLLGLILLSGTPITLPSDFKYLGALVYLSVFGSIIGFTTYLTLVAKIGSARAAYATVLFPIIALLLSTIYEGYVWHWSGIAGLIIALCGNVVMFYKPKTTPAPTAQTLQARASAG